MKKARLGPSAMLFPMPAVLVGGRGKNGDISFATIAWAGIVNSTPPMVGVGIRKSRLTHALISESGVFSVNVPSSRQALEADYCGLVSGRSEDKVKACGFTIFYGSLKDAPLIEECPFNLECRVERVIELPSHDFFIGEIVESHMDENLMADPKDGFVKIDPLVFLGTHYAGIAGNMGRAFAVGRKLKPKAS